MREIATWLLEFKLVRFLLVGSTGTVINFGLLWMLTEYAGMWYILSAAIAGLLATVNNYTLNHLWAFGDRKGSNGNKVLGFLKYSTAVGIGYLAYLALMALLTEVGIWYILSAGIATAVTIAIRFSAANWWVWRKSEKQTAKS